MYSRLRHTTSVLTARRLLHSQQRHRLNSYSTSTAGTVDYHAHCRNLVKKYDHESWLCSYFYPQKTQPAYFALKAFFNELAMIPDSVSNTTIGQMKLQFWKDAIASFSSDTPTKTPTPQHPIVLALQQAVAQHGIQTYHLKRIIDARWQELQNPTHMTIDALTAHSESTYSTLLYTLLQLFTRTPSHDISHAASHLGVAHSLMTLLRGLPFHASKGRIVIPAEMTAKHRVSHESVIRGGPRATGLSDAVFEFATAANDHLITAREMFEKDTKGKSSLMPVFLTGVVVQSFLSRLETVNFDPFHPSLHIRYWKLPWQIYIANLRGKF